MQVNVFAHPSRDLTEVDLAWLEATTRIRLPREVREHYLCFNGGEPENPLYVAGDQTFVVQEFFPIRHGPRGTNLEDHHRSLVEQDGIIPAGMIPFARDPAGDFFCFDSATGAVSLFRAEHLPDRQRCITRLAPSFAEFVAGLARDDADALSGRR